jgi:hypothetical protein
MKTKTTLSSTIPFESSKSEPWKNPVWFNEDLQIHMSIIGLDTSNIFMIVPHIDQYLCVIGHGIIKQGKGSRSQIRAIAWRRRIGSCGHFCKSFWVYWPESDVYLYWWTPRRRAAMQVEKGWRSKFFRLFLYDLVGLVTVWSVVRYLRGMLPGLQSRQALRSIAATSTVPHTTTTHSYLIPINCNLSIGSCYDEFITFSIKAFVARRNTK